MLDMKHILLTTDELHVCTNDQTAHITYHTILTL